MPTVSTAAQLTSALKAAAGGEILLAPGDYGTLQLDGRKFASEVTLRSADPNNRARFGYLVLKGVSNLTLDTILFDYNAPAGMAVTRKPFSVLGSDHIAILNSIFDGDFARGVSSAQDGHGTGYGLDVTQSADIAVKGNTFFHWYAGAHVGHCRRVVIIGNEFHSIRCDGMQMVAWLDDLLIEGNHYHDWLGGVHGDHRDMIQFWTVNQGTPTTNVTIRGNFFNAGGGWATQSIFMRNEAVDTQGKGSAMFYRNILIEDNLIHNYHSNAIIVGEADGVTVRNNTLLHARIPGYLEGQFTPAIGVKAGSLNVSITDNVMAKLWSTQAGETSKGLVVQYDDPNGDFYVGDLFVNALTGASATLADLRAKPGGLIEQKGYGAAMTRSGDVVDPAPEPEPEPDPQPEPAMSIGIGVTEAESLTLSGYQVEPHSRADASGGAGIKTTTSGTASGTFAGPAGSYWLDVNWWNEHDGEASFAVQVNGATVDSWTGVGGSAAADRETRRMAVELNEGDEITLVGENHAGEPARIDSIEVSVKEGAEPDPKPGPDPEPDPDLTARVAELEAENAALKQDLAAQGQAWTDWHAQAPKG